MITEVTNKKKTMLCELDLRNKRKDIYDAQLGLGGSNSNGDAISFTNYYMELNKKPFFGICGEFHYSRYDEAHWEDEIIKMKMCGVNIVASYIFWNHHEEICDEYRWCGNRDVRRFVQLCKLHGLFVILRIGPFNHGEVRNGGLPDWLYGRPFKVRSNDEEYMFYVRRFYQEIGNQVRGLMFKENGPVIGIQLENEFMASGAPWECSRDQNREFVNVGNDGIAHMALLKKIAIDNDLITPIYTCTGWGGAPIMEEGILPLYGGYAFWPWIYYGDVEEHPLTDNYIFYDYHNNNSLRVNEEYQPPYPPASMPYACCEMGGGMQVWYDYRFDVPPESVDAMSVVKIASGCNFIGYYMFHGGSNPVGEKSYLNESTCPHISYDFQAPLGEYGQVRESYKRLKLLHYFCQRVGEDLCEMMTVLPEESISIEDVESVRFAVRVKDGSGYVFVNNYQDHLEMQDKEDFKIGLKMENEVINIPAKGTLNLSKNANGILPFKQKLGGVSLRYATSQMITSIVHEGIAYYFFTEIEGMAPSFLIEKEEIIDYQIEGGVAEDLAEGLHISCLKEGGYVRLQSSDNIITCLVYMPRSDGNNFWWIKESGQERILLTDSAVLASDNQLELITLESPTTSFSVFPDYEDDITSLRNIQKGKPEGIFTTYSISDVQKPVEHSITKVSDNKAIVKFHDDIDPFNEVYLKINYTGDIGCAYINGQLISDNFANGQTWEIGLSTHRKSLQDGEVYIHIVPMKSNEKAKRDNAMAAIQEAEGSGVAEITKIKVVPEYRIRVL